jgi:hypothetical protein
LGKEKKEAIDSIGRFMGILLRVHGASVRNDTKGRAPKASAGDDTPSPVSIGILDRQRFFDEDAGTNT